MEHTLPALRPLPRLSLPLAVGIALSIATLTWILSSGQVHDVDAYWQGGLALREGTPLYDASGPNDTTAYRYAPWFAVLWVPLTFLPQPLVYTVWRLVLFGAVGWLLLQPGQPWIKALTLPLLALAAWWGNIQPLMVLWLVLGVERRSGPLWIALAASLKAAPAMLALVYLGRREWWRFGITAALTLVLVVPMALFDLSAYPTDPSGSLSLWWQIGPWAWAAGVIASIALVLWRPSWATGAVAVIAALPRLLLYDFSFLLLTRRSEARERGVRAVAHPLDAGKRQVGMRLQAEDHAVNGEGVGLRSAHQDPTDAVSPDPAHPVV